MKIKMTIGRRITYSSAFLCAIIVVLVAFAVSQLHVIDRVVNSIVGNSLPGLIHASEITHDLAENQILLNRIVLAKTEVSRREVRGEIDVMSAKITKAFADYEATITTDEDRRLFDEVRDRRAKYLGWREEMFAVVDVDPAAAEEILVAKTTPAYIDYTKAASKLMEFNRGVAVASGESLSEGLSRAVRILVIAGMVGLAVGLGIAIRNATKIAKMLRSIAGQLEDGATQVASAANQVSSSSSSLAQGASEQAASLEETSASLEESAGMTRRSAENAGHATATAKETREAADAGVEQMAALRSAMDAISTASAEITKILKTIDEIAFQTNILALNAAVEAARAGDAGAGFAVVAEEVRALAQRAAAAAKETAGKIEDSVIKSKLGADISEKVDRSFENIRTKIRVLDDLVAEIATATSEQSQGIGQITSAISEMDRVTQANASGAEETASAAEELNAQSQTLKGLVAELMELTGATTNTAINETGPLGLLRPVSGSA